MNHILKLQVQQAVSIIKNGGIVAFPTETVYGLGANVFDERAIQKIFDTKNRPADNPLIVHISSLEMLNQLITCISPENQKLINAFWPGPLGIVFPKSEVVPDIVTAGLDTVVIRFPDHPIAQHFISKCNTPIAAPSVNPSGKPSSTSVAQIRNYFENKVFIIEGNKSEIGLESTVINTLEETPVILRQGYISQYQIKQILDMKVELSQKTSKIQSPGMKYRHYAPEAKLKLVPIGEDILPRIEFYLAQNYIVGALVSTQIYNLLSNNVIGFDLGDKNNLKAISTNLYTGLHYFDFQEVDIILAESFPSYGLGIAIMDRLNKASE